MPVVVEVVGIATEARDRRIMMVRVVMVTQMGLQVERVRDIWLRRPGSTGRGMVDLVVGVVHGSTQNLDRVGVADTPVVKVLLMNN
tara:strand:- start:967 stop:1224 length:258 start_codon:yes stop_codon:yes gene_type:complete